MLRKCSTQEKQQGIKHESLPTTPGKSGERHQIPTKGILQKLSSAAKIIKSKESLEDGHSPDEPKETWGLKTLSPGDSLVVQWLGLCAFTAEVPGFDPWLGN